jgi:transposase
MAYGLDLRERALSYVETGHTIRETSEVFRVSEKTINNWKRLRREKGDIRAHLTGEVLTNYLMQNCCPT